MSLLELWVIYDHPDDYPDYFVVRPQSLSASGVVTPWPVVATAETIEEARRHLPRGLTCVQTRGDDPDPHIVEVWI